MRIWTNTDLKTDSLTAFQSFPFYEHGASSCITLFALLIRVSTSLFCLPSLVNTTPRYLNVLTCYSAFPLACIVRWIQFATRLSLLRQESTTFFAQQTGLSLALFCGQALNKIINQCLACRFITTRKSSWRWRSERSGLPLPQLGALTSIIIMVSGARTVFLLSVVPVTFGST